MRDYLSCSRAGLLQNSCVFNAGSQVIFVVIAEFSAAWRAPFARLAALNVRDLPLILIWVDRGH